jgi:glucose 1-dehydrogenase
LGVGTSTDQVIAFCQPKAASKEYALARRKAVFSGFRIITVHEAVNNEMLLDCRDRRLHPWIIGRQKADDGNAQQAGVEMGSAVRLNKALTASIIPILTDVAMDAALPNCLPGRAGDCGETPASGPPLSSCVGRPAGAGHRSESGIGRAVALGLAASGADVIVNYLVNPGAAEEVAHAIETGGRRALVIKADVSKEDDVKSMFARAIAHFGTLHIVVPNAGLQRDAPIDEMTLEQWKTVIDVNLTGQFLCAREAAREFKRRGVASAVSSAAGKLIMTSSVHQEIPRAGHANYAASKGGIMQLMRSLAQELAPLAVRANAVAPGAVRTPINRPAWDTPEAYRDLMTLVPYKRIGEPEDIAQAVAWLASDAADYVTGATLFVDGGMALYPGFATGG